MIKSMSTFVRCWKRTLNESPVAIKLSDEIIVEVTSDLEMSKERSRFKEHLRQSFELERSISSHQFGKSRKHSNGSQSSVLLKIKPGLDNDGQTNKPVRSVSNGGLARRLSSQPHTAGQGFMGRNLPFAHRFSVAAARARERTHAALPSLLPMQTKPRWFLSWCACTFALATAFRTPTPLF